MAFCNKIEDNFPSMRNDHKSPIAIPKRNVALRPQVKYPRIGKERYVKSAVVPHKISLTIFFFPLRK